MNDILKEIENLIISELSRRDEIKTKNSKPIDFDSMNYITLGLIDGDGIGPTIMDATIKVIDVLLKDQLDEGKIKLKRITGLNLENRIAQGQTVPQDVLTEIKSCNILLKGPTTTPGKGDNLPNITSANVTLRKELDLFANVRPVVIPEKNINWTFFRENTEGEYALGSKGIEIDQDMAIDFKITTNTRTARIAKLAFDYAANNNNQKVSIITKANIIKKTDGKFLEKCLEVAKDYPSIETDSWYVDITAANLINPQINSSFNVFILPNLYGDIITDEAAQMQGGVGTAGSANIGYDYGMFEAIHGSAPRMVEEGLSKYANPESLLRALVMLLRHISMGNKADLLENALNKSSKTLNMSGINGSNTCNDFAIETIKSLSGENYDYCQ